MDKLKSDGRSSLSLGVIIIRFSEIPFFLTLTKTDSGASLVMNKNFAFGFVSKRILKKSNMSSNKYQLPIEPR